LIEEIGVVERRTTDGIAERVDRDGSIEAIAGATIDPLRQDPFRDPCRLERADLAIRNGLSLVPRVPRPLRARRRSTPS
jgi:hypothetical protein